MTSGAVSAALDMRRARAPHCSEVVRGLLDFSYVKLTARRAFHLSSRREQRGDGKQHGVEGAHCE
jgi:hypothetical protein